MAPRPLGPAGPRRRRRIPRDVHHRRASAIAPSASCSTRPTSRPGPIARIRLPERISSGTHSCWAPQQPQLTLATNCCASARRPERAPRCERRTRRTDLIRADDPVCRSQVRIDDQLERLRVHDRIAAETQLERHLLRRGARRRPVPRPRGLGVTIDAADVEPTTAPRSRAQLIAAQMSASFGREPLPETRRVEAQPPAGDRVAEAADHVPGDVDAVHVGHQDLELSERVQLVPHVFEIAKRQRRETLPSRGAAIQLVERAQIAAGREANAYRLAQSSAARRVAVCRLIPSRSSSGERSRSMRTVADGATSISVGSKPTARSASATRSPPCASCTNSARTAVTRHKRWSSCDEQGDRGIARVGRRRPGRTARRRSRRAPGRGAPAAARRRRSRRRRERRRRCTSMPEVCLSRPHADDCTRSPPVDSLEKVVPIRMVRRVLHTADGPPAGRRSHAAGARRVTVRSRRRTHKVGTRYAESTGSARGDANRVDITQFVPNAP